MPQDREFVVAQSKDLCLLRRCLPKGSRQYHVVQFVATHRKWSDMTADGACGFLERCLSFSALRAAKAIVEAEQWAKLIKREWSELLRAAPELSTATDVSGQ